MDDKSPELPELPGPGPTLWPWLLALVLVTAGLRVVQIARTETTTRDSISFVRVAWKLHTLPLGQALRTSEQHPLYPALVLAASPLTRALHPDDLPLAMSLACQYTSCLASVALAVVLFFLGRELFTPAIGFWGALLFQILPGPGRLMADGLSEPVFLVLACTALVASVRGLSGKHPAWFALAGLCGGLAYLTRPEGLIIPSACLLVLVWWRVRTGKLSFTPRAALLLVPLLAVSMPYMVTIGGLTRKPAAEFALDPDKWKKEGLFKPVKQETKAAVASPLPFALWWFGPDVTPDMRWGWAFKALLHSLGEPFFHAGLALVLLGLWVYRRRISEEPGWALMLVLGVVLTALCYRVAQSNGYLSARHVILLTAAGSFALVAGLVAVGGLLWQARPAWGGLAAVLLVAGLSLPKLLAPLHDGRGAFRAAGEWIARNAQPGDRVWDPYAHAYYHAGRVFTEGQEGLPAAAPAVTYVVLDTSANKHEHLFYLHEAARRMAEGGEELVHFSAEKKRQRNKGDVVVYRFPKR